MPEKINKKGAISTLHMVCDYADKAVELFNNLKILALKVETDLSNSPDDTLTEDQIEEITKTIDTWQKTANDLTDSIQ